MLIIMIQSHNQKWFDNYDRVTTISNGVAVNKNDEGSHQNP